ncbi:MAG: hypothetical protein GXO29_01920 [Thermotogae bacterium]|nr:hypothetical protein [Thermotogota bacterium]
MVGFEYDTSSLIWAWQLLDPLWLREDLLTSLWNMHMQPPLFNLLTATVLKSNLPPKVLLDPLYLTLGALTTLTLHAIARRLGFSEILSFLAVALIFTLNPASIVYETWYFYTYPALFLTSLAVLSMMEFSRSGALLPLLGVFATLSLLILLRSTYNLLLIPSVAAVLAWHLRRRALRIMLVASLFALPPLLWYGKNLVKFGLFSSSSWFPMNLLQVITGEHTLLRGNRERIVSLHRRGEVSAVATLPPFSPPEVYEAFLGPSPPAGVEALDAPRKPSSGRINYNHRIYPEVFKVLLRDHMLLLRRMPDAYVVGTAAGALYFTLPPYAHTTFSPRLFAEGNRRRLARLRPWLKAYDLAYGWMGGLLPGITVLLLLVVFIRGLPDALREPIRAAPSLFLLYLVLVHAPFERGENMRFRFQFEPPLILFALRSAFRRGPTSQPSCTDS